MKPMNALRCVWTLAGVLLAGAAQAAGGEEFLAAASTGAGVLLDNAATKTALDSETLVLPVAWGGAAADGLTVRAAGGSASSDIPLDASAETYDWDTLPLLPGAYTLTLTAGGETYTATYEVTATAVAEWGTLAIDNGTTAASGGKTYVADGERETLVLPAAWGETVAGEITVTVSGGPVPSEQSLDASAETYDWATGPLLPGTYDVTLKWNGTSSTATYTVAALAEATLVGDGAATIDNAVDADGVRRAAGWSRTFTLRWPGLAGDVALACNGKTEAATAAADGTWTWNTDGLVRGIYTFTHTADGQTETAKFHLDSDLLGVLFGDDAVLPVPAEWYVANVSETIPDAAAEVSDSLKASAQNGHAYWKNYVLGWDPADVTAALLAKVVKVDAETGAATVRLTGMNPPQEGAFGDLTLKYVLRKADSEASAFTQVGDAQDSPEFTDTTFATDAQQRYYRPAAVLEKK